jgi:hypothetical protein
MGVVFDRLRNALDSLERAVTELEPAHLDGPGAAKLVDLFARAERLCGAGKALAARRADDVGAWRHDGHRSGAHWLAATTGVSVGTATATLETARALDALPDTADAFRAGELSAVQAHEVTSAALESPESEGDLLEAAKVSSLKRLRDHCRRARMSAADDAAAAAHLHATRRVHTWTDPDGAYRADIRLTPDAGAHFHAALTDNADRIFTEARKRGRREPWSAYLADALVALAAGGPCKPIDVRLSVSHRALARGYVMPGEHCELEHVGPVPVTTARHLLDDSRIIVLAHDGHDVTKVSTPKRTIPATLRRALEARHPVCGVAGCDTSTFLQIDHITPIEAAGETTLENTWRLCTHHHDLKSYRGWRVVGEGASRTLVPPDSPLLSGKDPP